MNFKKRSMSLRSLPVWSLLLTGLLFMHCSTQDEESIQPANEDFNKVEDLPDLVDPDPEEVVVEIGEINDSPLTESIIDELSNAGSEAEIGAEAKNILDGLEKYADFFANGDPEIVAFLNGLDAEKISAILKGEEEISPELKEFAASISQNKELAALFPQIIFPEINGEAFKVMPEETVVQNERKNEAGARKKTATFSEHQLRVSELVGPCAGTAKEAFDLVVGELEGQKDDQLATIEANYERRISELESRNELRLTLQEETFSLQANLLILNVTTILQAANQIEGEGSAELKIKLLTFVAAYLVQAIELIKDWNDLSLATIQEAYERELQAIKDQRDARIEEVIAAYERAVKLAEEILNLALDACHNQGAGN